MDKALGIISTLDRVIADFCRVGLTLVALGVFLGATRPVFAQGSLTVGTVNNTCNANQQAGADLGAKINACLALGNNTDVLVSASGNLWTPVLINNLLN